MTAPDEIAVERISATHVLVDGRELAAFSGCGYLGLAHHPDVLAEARRELATSGLSVGASRTTSGTSSAHLELERALARFVGKSAAILAADGYLSNLLAAQGLRERLDHARIAHGSHASIEDAVAATFERRAPWNAGEELPRGVALFTDGMFASARRLAPLDELAQRLERDLGALVVDDCHALGVLGARGRGTCEHFGVAHEHLVITGTLSKALGGFGGFVAGSEELIDAIRSRARAYAGATPIPVACARASLAALAVLDREPQRLARLRARIARVRAAFVELRLPVSSFDNPVFAFTAPEPLDLAALHAAWLRDGFFVPLVEYPDGLGRYLRLALCSEHDDRTLDGLLKSLARALGRA